MIFSPFLSSNLFYSEAFCSVVFKITQVFTHTSFSSQLAIPARSTAQTGTPSSSKEASKLCWIPILYFWNHGAFIMTVGVIFCMTNFISFPEATALQHICEPEKSPQTNIYKSGLVAIKQQKWRWVKVIWLSSEDLHKHNPQRKGSACKFSLWFLSSTCLTVFEKRGIWRTLSYVKHLVWHSSPAK